jgi:GTPase obg
LSHLGLAGTSGEMKFKQNIYEFDAAKPFFVMPISSATGQNINELKFNLLELLKKEL